MSDTVRAHADSDVRQAGSCLESARARVLVLLAACNGSAWIADQIASILGQADVKVTLVIRDDRSCDSTLEEIGRFQQDERVSVLRSPTPTGSAAQNFFALIRSIPPGEHDFVALADQDDIWHRQRLSHACSALRDTSSVGYSSATLAFWPNGRTKVLRQTPRTTPADFLFEGAGQGCTFVLTASFYSKARDFLIENEAQTKLVHYHDWTIYALSRSWDHAWIFDSTPSVSYRQHPSNDTGARASTAALAKRLALVKNGWYRKQIALISDICAKAAPANGTVITWQQKSTAASTWKRRLTIAAFSLMRGRRKPSDRLLVSLFALLGWL